MAVEACVQQIMRLPKQFPLWPLLISLGLHVGIVAVARRGQIVKSPDFIAASAPADTWAGETLMAPDLEGPKEGQSSQAAGATKTEEGAKDPVVLNKPAEHEAKLEPKPKVAKETKPKAPGQDLSSPDKSEAKTKRSSQAHKPGAAASSIGAGASSASAGGSFGAEGRAGIRNLATAFTRAIPVAVSGDPIWGTLPMGAAGSFRLSVKIDEDGKIISAIPVDENPSEQLRAIASKTISLLKSGRFALSYRIGEEHAGEETLRISVKLVMAEVPSEGIAGGAYGLGYEAPSPGHAGKAQFTLTSGRRVEIRVETLDPSKGRARR